MEKNNLKKNTVFLTIGAILNKGLVFLMIPLFSSWLATNDYGTFDLFCTYITMLIPLFSFSIGDGVFRLGIESKKREKKEFITGGLLIYVIGSFILGTIVLILFGLYKNEIIVPFYLLFIGEFFNKYLQSFLRTIKKLNIYSFSTVISTIFIFVSVYIFVRIFNLNLKGMIIGYAVGYAIGNIVIIIWSKFYKFLDKELNFDKIKSMVKYSVPLIPNSLSWWIVDASDRTIISLILGNAFNGIYAIAYKIPNLCTNIFGMFSIAWQEAAIDMNNSEERNKYYNLIYNKMIIILISLCIGILSCNFILFNYVFDIRYSEAHFYTPILVTSVLFCSIAQFFGGIQISLKKTKENGITTIIGAIINIIIHITLIKFIGLYAAAISTMISNLLIAILRKKAIKKDVIIVFNKSNIKYVVLFIYFAISAYYYQRLPMLVNIINLFISMIVCVYINKEFLEKLLIKVFKKEVKI